jgi:RNA polymerase sigma factor (sigma-70 family)
MNLRLLKREVDMNLQVEKMIEDNKRLIYSIANSIYIKNKLFTKDDLIQVGFLALCRSGHKYDETRGKVSTFITHCVRNDMLKFIKSNKLQGDLIYSENKNLSYNNNQDLMCLDYTDICCAKTELEKNIAQLKIAGETNKSISNKLNISLNKVSKIISLMRSRMEKRQHD